MIENQIDSLNLALQKLTEAMHALNQSITLPGVIPVMPAAVPVMPVATPVTPVLPAKKVVAHKIELTEIVQAVKDLCLKVSVPKATELLGKYNVRTASKLPVEHFPSFLADAKQMLLVNAPELDPAS